MSHIHEKIDWTVEVFIVHKNRVLLRKHDKYNIWLSVGGHIELDEDPVEAAKREVKEEVGLDVQLIGRDKGKGDGSVADHGYLDLLPPKYLGRHPINDNHEHITLVYFATTETSEASDPSDIEDAEIFWATKEDLEKMDLSPNVKWYAQKALEELSTT
ncbi:MAG TPA: NUDIX domain-containing protein [Candidatus Paceibacterota bacterium]|nr:NUDIX domain-containing protein [Candidatus Paceibacterota bacterium]